ncbi:GNAT family N-acetyltransferase [Marmoricola sp. URHB0036]|uniref:GNAT family N-acetyltransferase n=1 Tax=Marmoricola sp. URHB0036 TaxID=1298863 RepID=UPI0004126C1A|nr:GNAT family N-acetyltransferase [Marmoricola sp. URHB0036]
MSDPVAQVHDAHVRRLAGIDPLVRVGSLDVTSEACVEWSADRQAVALVDVRETDPESEAGLWVEDRVVRLQVRAATDQAAAATHDLLERAHRIAGDACTTHVSVASRDTAMVRPLLRAGFAPNAVLAVHRLTRSDVQPLSPGEQHEVAVREARPDDLDAVVAADVAVQAYDARLGGLPERPDAERVIRPGVEKALRERPGWTWVAELDGAVVGVCQMEPPEDAQWVAGEVASPSTAYLADLHVDPAARGRQVGSRLVAAAHLRATAAGAQVVLLHHAAANPLSTPFWARAGYRPLVTGWARRVG